LVEGVDGNAGAEADVARFLFDVWTSIAAAGPVGKTVSTAAGLVTRLNEAVEALGNDVYFVPIDRTLEWVRADNDEKRTAAAEKVKEAMAHFTLLHPYGPSQWAAVGVMTMDQACSVARRGGTIVGAAGGELLEQARGALVSFKTAYQADDRERRRRAIAARAAQDKEDAAAGVAGARKGLTLTGKWFAEKGSRGAPYDATTGRVQKGGLRKKRRTKKKASIKSTRKKSARKSTRKKSARKSKGSKRTYRRKPTLRKTRGVKRKSRK